MSKENMSDYSLNAKLCRLVQENPCMYDRSFPNYLKKDFVDRAWMKIAKELNEPVGSCKERWRNIRTAFARSVNIYKTPTGPNRHKRYYLHDELQFLTKHIAPGLPCISTPVIDEVNGNSRQSMAESDENSNLHITIDTSETPPPNETDDERVRAPDHTLAESPPSPVTKRRRSGNADDAVDSRKDLDFEFLRSLLFEMRAMNARQKIIFKGKIFRALEEVFDDSKDFPRRSEPAVMTGSTVVSAQKASNRSMVHNNVSDRESISLHNAHMPIVTLGSVEVKQEPLCLDD